MTPNLALPLMDADQAQKHLTYNEALMLLDGLVQLTVVSAAVSTPPAEPAEGQRWIVAAGATDDWEGEDGNVALWVDDQWRFFEPQTGWTAYDQDTGTLLSFSSGAWSQVFAAGMSGLFGAGSAAAPSIAFSVDPDTGIYRVGADQLGFATGGANRMTIGSTGDVSLASTTQATSVTAAALKLAGGLAVAMSIFLGGVVAAPASDSASAPSYTWAGDTNTGLFHAAADTIGFATAGTESLRINATGQLLAQNGSAAAPAMSFAADADTGLYRSAANTLGLATNGTASLLIDANGSIGQPTVVSGISFNTAMTLSAASSASFSDSNTLGSGVTGTYRSFFANAVSTAAASFTLSNLIGFQCTDFALGAGSSVTNHYGFYCTNFAASGATNHYAFYTLMASGGGRFAFYGAGTAPSYLAGILTVDNATNATSNTTGAVVITGGLGVGTDIVTGGVLAGANGSASAPTFTFASDTDTGLYRSGGNTLGFATAGVQAMLLSGSNNLLIGAGSIDTTVMVDMQTPGSSGSSLTGYKNTTLLPSSQTGTYRAFNSVISTANGSFTVNTVHGFVAEFGTLGSNSAITNYYGFNAANSLRNAGGNVYGFYSALNNGTNIFAFYGNGSAPSLFNGNVTVAASTASTAVSNGALVVAGGAGIGGDIHGGGAILSSSSTAGIGYEAGAGGTVTQTGSKSTSVTLNKITGQITMHSQTMSGQQELNFTLNNSRISAGDIVIVAHVSGGSAGSYVVWCANTQSGSCIIRVKNTGDSGLGEAIVIAFAVIKAVST
jgi:hypothetical protein